MRFADLKTYRYEIYKDADGIDVYRHPITDEVCLASEIMPPCGFVPAEQSSLADSFQVPPPQSNSLEADE